MLPGGGALPDGRAGCGGWCPDAGSGRYGPGRAAGGGALPDGCAG
ncbi:hypothetical protein ATKI12_9076 [Kitasatospora sp. Ki12]